MKTAGFFFLFSLLLQAFHFNYPYDAGVDIGYNRIGRFINYASFTSLCDLDPFLISEARAFKFDTNVVVSVSHKFQDLLNSWKDL